MLRDEELARIAAAECGTLTPELMADHRRRIAVNTREGTRRSSRRAALAPPAAAPVEASRSSGEVQLGQAETTLRWAGYARGDDGSWSLPEGA